MPDIIVVAEGIRETTATDVVPAFEGVVAYTYESHSDVRRAHFR